MNYQMLAMNIDGTLLHDNGRLHKSTRESIEFAVEKGIYVTLVTSRPFASAKRVARALKLDTFLVTQSGSFIASDAEKPISVKKLTEEKTYELAKFLEQVNGQVRVMDEQRTLSNKIPLQQQLLAKAVFQPAYRLTHAYTYVDSICDVLQETPMAASKVEVTFENRKTLDDVHGALDALFDEFTYIVCEDNRLEITTKGVSKLNGVKYICDRLGVKNEKVVMIGSSQDDIPLMEWAGLGVAMGQSSKKVLAAADWVTRSNQENGVAYMVKEHFRKQQHQDFLSKFK